MDYQEIQNEEIEINLAELFQVLKEHLHIIIISTLICAILVGAFTIFFVSKKYESTARIFPKPEVNEGIVDYSQINSNNSMTKNYVALLEGNNIQSKVAKELNVDTNVVSSALSISNETDTQIISISATTTDPQLSKKIVDTTVNVFTNEVKETLNINNITTVVILLIFKVSFTSFVKTLTVVSTILQQLMMQNFKHHLFHQMFLKI